MDEEETPLPDRMDPPHALNSRSEKADQPIAQLLNKAQQAY